MIYSGRTASAVSSKVQKMTMPGEILRAKEVQSVDESGVPLKIWSS